jgi:hypothetical protein
MSVLAVGGVSSRSVSEESFACASACAVMGWGAWELSPGGDVSPVRFLWGLDVLLETGLRLAAGRVALWLKGLRRPGPRLDGGQRVDGEVRGEGVVRADGAPSLIVMTLHFYASQFMWMYATGRHGRSSVSSTGQGQIRTQMTGAANDAV